MHYNKKYTSANKVAPLYPPGKTTTSYRF